MKSRDPSDPSALGPGAEFDLIRSIIDPQRGTGAPEVCVGPGDDAAVLEIDDKVVISTDLTIEGVHFQTEWLTPVEVGYRAAAAALSDLAAMAARPLGILLSIGVDRDRATIWAPAISQGALTVLEYTGGSLLGGDLSRVPSDAPVVIDVVAVGQTENPVTRAGADAGDEVWVTGTLGWPALAVREWLAGRTPNSIARQRFANPTPRVHEALWLRDHGTVTAMIDLSDGLAADVGHLAAASGVGISLRAEALPVPTELTKLLGLKEASSLALAGGEEYELCLTARAGSLDAITEDFASRFGVLLTKVGVVTAGTSVDIVGAELVELGSGHDHFRDNDLA